ncbi:MAPEG family protein [Rhizobium sp. L1K21]|uniref:MAPEG family protein n=1 Tax=Rhizobium sp. L1K21 TaxID=2954933 RepID=UPI002092C5E8|nr:MAPEG family protein [Rhizobium sp. L1K21]MCO6184711.1 MAPEG family protein [Rhizobium sp. L1K21]
MTFAITSLYASIFTLMLIVLSNIVSARRGKTGLSILHGEDMQLAYAIRRHGNFVETVPFALILMLLAESAAMPVLPLHAAGILLVVSRIAHIFGLKADGKMHFLRIAGGVGTQLAMLSLVIYLCWTILQ